MLWNQVDALQKHLKKDHVHMRLWTRLYGITGSHTGCGTITPAPVKIVHRLGIGPGAVASLKVTETCSGILERIYENLLLWRVPHFFSTK